MALSRDFRTLNEQEFAPQERKFCLSERKNNRFRSKNILKLSKSAPKARNFFEISSIYQLTPPVFEDRGGGLTQGTLLIETQKYQRFFIFQFCTSRCFNFRPACTAASKSLHRHRSGLFERRLAWMWLSRAPHPITYTALNDLRCFSWWSGE